ncbi:MAG: response regulator, partial [Desulfomonilia bacterium]|nr:response regulator [Desulfomonilia bacterium]
MRSKHRILVLDDEPNIVEVLITRLEALGFPVQGCTSAQKALDILRKEEFSLLITDMKMPDMDGMEVLRKVKKIDPDLEVIILTAYGSIEGAVRAIQQGAHDYLVKPFEPVELVVKIESALEKRELKQRVKYLEQEVEDRLDHRIYAQSSAMKR